MPTTRKHEEQKTIEFGKLYARILAEMERVGTKSFSEMIRYMVGVYLDTMRAKLSGEADIGSPGESSDSFEVVDFEHFEELHTGLEKERLRLGLGTFADVVRYIGVQHLQKTGETS